MSDRLLVLYPAVDDRRLAAILAAARGLHVVNAATEADARVYLPRADAFFGQLTPGLLAVAERLAWVQSPTASLERFLFPELIEHPCVLTNMRGIYCDPIADQVLGYLIVFARQFLRYFAHRQQRRWDPAGGEASRQDFAHGPGVVSAIDLAHATLAGATLGIVGLGQIGEEITRRALAHRMRIVAIDPRPRDVPDVAWVRPPEDLPALLAESDYVVVAAPLTPGTRGWFGAEQFARMKPSAIFINIGRGAIVSLDALVQALETKQIAGAALDVFEQEPLPSQHRLWEQENVILTPHVAGFAPGIAERHLEVLVENVRRFAHGEPLRNVVDKRAWC